MYSKSKGMTDRDITLTPPPGYDGSRFRKRSDGRDDSFPLYYEDTHRYGQQKKCRERHRFPSDSTYCPNRHMPKEEVHDCLDEEIEDGECCECEAVEEEKAETAEPCEKKETRENPIKNFLKELGSEEILLIALIVLLSGNQTRAGLETVLILSLLLCIT